MIDNFNIEAEIIKNSHVKCELIFLKEYKHVAKYKFFIDDLPNANRKDILDLVEKKFSDHELIRQDTYNYDDQPFIDEDQLQKQVDSSTIIYLSRSKKSIIAFYGSSIEIISDNQMPEDLIKDIKNIRDSKNRNGSVFILSYNNQRGMYLTGVEIDEKFKDIDINLNYNDDFIEIDENIKKSLISNNMGLYLLHGLHGTGKTTYLRHLIRNINKRIIFISPDMADKFSSPEMIPFLMDYKDSIIIIEDSENIIRSRKGGDNQSVSNLLNISDGILGDCLRFQVICTFNTNKDNIDEALLRKGRLLESYEFKELTIEKTNKLLLSLGQSPSNREMKLSDIYNIENNNHYEKREKVGFNF
jgi:hypothetical protein